ncbi:hypothetical protein BT96DRAFT_931400 [Gymnopus androsaceus JB14]|uniref:Uncharacterized protein n=1 Tax=Gymnopus androsaceus JB14 TaxID=1447944 RepID=A0A6A4IN94_9AGAR|nr:hypothetical protein BT96DRAFT_931400 [Gymnopus androsaceus JB14]
MEPRSAHWRSQRRHRLKLQQPRIQATSYTLRYFHLNPNLPPVFSLPVTPPNVRAARLAKHKKSYSIPAGMFFFGLVDDMNEIDALTAGLKVGDDMKSRSRKGRFLVLELLEAGRAIESKLRQHTALPGKVEFRRNTLFGADSIPNDLFNLRGNPEETARSTVPHGWVMSTRSLGLRAKLPHGVDTARSSIDEPSAASTVTLLEEFVNGLQFGPQAESTPRHIVAHKQIFEDIVPPFRPAITECRPPLPTSSPANRRSSINTILTDSEVARRRRVIEFKPIPELIPIIHSKYILVQYIKPSLLGYPSRDVGWSSGSVWDGTSTGGRLSLSFPTLTVVRRIDILDISLVPHPPIPGLESSTSVHSDVPALFTRTDKLPLILSPKPPSNQPTGLVHHASGITATQSVMSTQWHQNPPISYAGYFSQQRPAPPLDRCKSVTLSQQTNSIQGDITQQVTFLDTSTLSHKLSDTATLDIQFVEQLYTAAAMTVPPNIDGVTETQLVNETAPQGSQIYLAK